MSSVLSIIRIETQGLPLWNVNSFRLLLLFLLVRMVFLSVKQIFCFRVTGLKTSF